MKNAPSPNKILALNKHICHFPVSRSQFDNYYMILKKVVLLKTI